MIGSVVQSAGSPQMGEISTKLMDELQQKMGRPAKVFPNLELESFKNGDHDFWFSASSVHSLCPRLCAIAVRDKMDMGGPVDSDLAWIFAVGTGYHRAFQDELLQKLGDVFQGGWDRDCDGVLERVEGATQGPWTERGWGPKPEGDRWRYREPKGRIPHVRLVGKWDGVLVWPDDIPEVLELKSIREDQFHTVNPLAGGHPKADHILQVHAYMWMSGLNRARIVYMAKGSQNMRSSVAEHVVARDEKVIWEMERTLLRCLESMESVLAGGEIPERPVGCRIKSDTRARKCNLKDACFAVKVKKKASK